MVSNFFGSGFLFEKSLFFGWMAFLKPFCTCQIFSKKISRTSGELDGQIRRLLGCPWWVEDMTLIHLPSGVLQDVNPQFLVDLDWKILMRMYYKQNPKDNKESLDSCDSFLNLSIQYHKLSVFFPCRISDPNFLGFLIPNCLDPLFGQPTWPRCSTDGTPNLGGWSMCFLGFGTWRLPGELTREFSGAVFLLKWMFWEEIFYLFFNKPWVFFLDKFVKPIKMSCDFLVGMDIDF